MNNRFCSLWSDIPNDKGGVRLSAAGVRLHVIAGIGAGEEVQTRENLREANNFPPQMTCSSKLGRFLRMAHPGHPRREDHLEHNAIGHPRHLRSPSPSWNGSWYSNSYEIVFWQQHWIMQLCRVQRQQPLGGARRLLAPLQAARPPLRQPLPPAAHRLHGEQDAHHVQDGGELCAADWFRRRLRRWGYLVRYKSNYGIKFL